LRLEQVLRKIETPKQVAEVERPGLWFDFQDWTIIVGRNARENDELLRHYARGLDTWLHTRDVQGGFVFIKNKPGKTIPLPVLIAAGNLAVYFSKARSEARADLYYTQVKHLKRARGGKKSEKSSLTGKVLPSHEKNLFIQLDTKLLQELGL
jgi:predicted ribosome quality control (RQC) complex YloA/Tae2 family protein